MTTFTINLEDATGLVSSASDYFGSRAQAHREATRMALQTFATEVGLRQEYPATMRCRVTSDDDRRTEAFAVTVTIVEE